MQERRESVNTANEVEVFQPVLTDKALYMPKPRAGPQERGTAGLLMVDEQGTVDGRVHSSFTDIHKKCSKCWENVNCA